MEERGRSTKTGSREGFASLRWRAKPTKTSTGPAANPGPTYDVLREEQERSDDEQLPGKDCHFPPEVEHVVPAGGRSPEMSDDAQTHPADDDVAHSNHHPIFPTLPYRV
mgnify:CR=1 FL=1